MITVIATRADLCSEERKWAAARSLTMTNENKTDTGKTLSPIIIFTSLVVIVGVAVYMIAGGLSPSGAPIEQAPVVTPNNPSQR